MPLTLKSINTETITPLTLKSINTKTLYDFLGRTSTRERGGILGEYLFPQGVSSEGTLPVWVGYCQHVPQPAQFESGGASASGGCGDEEEGADHQDDEDEDGDGDT
nr:hypothetical protein [Tanacetum cinerariifolium]